MENRSKIADEVSWSTTEAPLSPEEEDAIVTLVVIVVVILGAIILLFSMGLFIDCKTQQSSTSSWKQQRKKRLRLSMPPVGRAQRSKRPDDAKCLATDMCPSNVDAVV